MIEKLDKNENAFLVRRRLVIPAIQSDTAVQAIYSLLGDLPGMQRVGIELKKKRLSVSYDTSQLGFADIEAALVSASFPPVNNWWARFKSAWYCYQDENDRITATSKGGACCSNPGDIYAKRHK